MNRYNKAALETGLIILILTKFVMAQDLSWESISREITGVNTILISSKIPRAIYIGTEEGIFKSSDKGDTWQMSLLIKGANRKVNFLLEDNQGLLYAATGRGLFLSRNQGKKWQRIFRGRDARESDCQALVVLPNGVVCLGTKAGLFISKDKARTWHKISGSLKDIAILAITYDKENKIIYVAAEDGVYKIIGDKLDSYKRVFITRLSRDEDQTEDEEDEDSSLNSYTIRYITLDHNQPANIYLATNSGIYKSKDYGESWQLMLTTGLLSRDIKFVLVSKRSFLFVVGKSGVFVYRKEKWEELSLRLPTVDIRFLALDKENNLYAATNKGLFKTNLIYKEEMNKVSKNKDYFKDEPTIRQLHLAALKYAQVIDPERIEVHRRQARLKAFLPDFSLDYDKTISSYNNSSSCRFSVGPGDWGASLKWNLSDLIWSEQQRLIDSQVRLMVQLRNDILDEVTKLYFERRRLNLEILSGNLNSKKKIEKELKLEELAASLDALTGGYFSQSLSD